jgi:hypothetical protein
VYLGGLTLLRLFALALIAVVSIVQFFVQLFQVLLAEAQLDLFLGSVAVESRAQRSSQMNWEHVSRRKDGGKSDEDVLFLGILLLGNVDRDAVLAGMCRV